MSAADYVILAIIAVAIFFAVRSLVRRGKKGGCGCGCSDCSGCPGSKGGCDNSKKRP